MLGHPICQTFPPESFTGGKGRFKPSSGWCAARPSWAVPAPVSSSNVTACSGTNLGIFFDSLTNQGKTSSHKSSENAVCSDAYGTAGQREASAPRAASSLARPLVTFRQIILIRVLRCCQLCCELSCRKQNLLGAFPGCRTWSPARYLLPAVLALPLQPLLCATDIKDARGAALAGVLITSSSSSEARCKSL